jgi:hypothetical protein
MEAAMEQVLKKWLARLTAWMHSPERSEQATKVTNKTKAALHDVRESETGRKAEAKLRDLRDGETGRKAEAALRDLRDSDAARKAKSALRDLKDSVTGTGKDEH